MSNLTLYVKHGCPWCKKVLDFSNEHGIQFSVIREKSEPGVLQEVLARGGKSQFPYLYNEDEKWGMYESSDIVTYLHKAYLV